MEEAREVSEVREEGLEAKLRAAGGDLRALTPKERVVYYHLLCEKLSLDPALAPIQFLELDGKLRPYITRAGAEALRKVHGVSTSLLRSEVQEGLFVVAVRATLPDGRHEEAVAVADIRDKKGDALVNACLFAETKAKRRATLSLLGLGYFLDETEALSIPTARFASFDTETGEVTPAPSPSPEERRGGASDLVSKLRDYFLALGMRDKGVNGAVITALTGKPSFRPPRPRRTRGTPEGFSGR